jgi:putative ABC transport system permease protein
MNIRSTFIRFLNLFRDASHRDVDTELDAHLYLAIQENRKAGMPDAEARRQAFLKLGGLEQTKELIREQQSLPIFESLSQDTRFALRLLKKSPAFAAVAVFSLALGIGANTAIFSVMRQILLQRLPVTHPEQLVLLYSPGPRDGHVSSDEGDGSESFSYPMYLDLRDKISVFSGLAAKADFPVSLAIHGQTERADAELVSGNYFETLQVRPALGRLIEPSDTPAPGSNPIVVLDYGYWQKRFGGDPSVLNQTVQVNEQPMTIVGVVQPGFTGIKVGSISNLYIPITMKPIVTPATENQNHRGLMNHDDYWSKLIGRLRPGLSPSQAATAIAPTYHALLENELPFNSGLSDREKKEFVQRQIILRDGSRGRPLLEISTRSQLLTLMGMVALVLFITCANVAGLLTARGTARQKEISIRLSLGASRWRLIRQLVIESCLLALLGAVVGLVLAHWVASTLVHYASAHNIADGLSAAINLPVLLFTFLLALLCGIFFGVVPAVASTRLQLASSLKEQAGAIAYARSQARLRQVLVISQVALTLLLVTVSCGFVRSLYNLKNTDLGFRPDHILQFSIAPTLNGYNKDRSLAFYSELDRKLAVLPGVRSLSAAELPLMNDQDGSSTVTLAGYNDTPDVERNSVGPGHFSNLGIPLLQGREFTVTDTAASAKVAIVNETLAKQYFPTGQALGKLMKFGGGLGPLDTQIVGVVRDSHHSDINEKVRPFIYTPYTQARGLSSLTYYLRTSNDPAALATTVRGTVTELDASLPVYGVRTFEEQINERLSSSRLLAVLALAFGSLAALLAAMGIYALLAYTVAQRTRDIGVRMALGAAPKRVALLILSDIARLAIAGILLGIPLAYAAGKVVDSMLFNVHSFALPSLSVALLALATTAAAAAYLPARRAAQVDPIIALRYE